MRCVFITLLYYINYIIIIILLYYLYICITIYYYEKQRHSCCSIDTFHFHVVLRRATGVIVAVEDTNTPIHRHILLFYFKRDKIWCVSV